MAPPFMRTSPEALTKNPSLVFETVEVSVNVPKLIKPSVELPEIVKFPVDKLNSSDFMSSKLPLFLIKLLSSVCKLKSPEPDKNTPLPVILAF